MLARRGPLWHGCPSQPFSTVDKIHGQIDRQTGRLPGLLGFWSTAPGWLLHGFGGPWGACRHLPALSARNWGGNERCRAPDLRICRVLLALWAWRHGEIRSLLTARYRVFPEIPVSVTFRLPSSIYLGVTIRYRYCTQVPDRIPRPPPRVHRICQLARDVEPGRPIRARTGEPRPLEQRVGHHYHTTLFALRTLTTTRLSMGCRVRNHTMEGSGSDMHRR